MTEKKDPIDELSVSEGFDALEQVRREEREAKREPGEQSPNGAPSNIEDLPPWIKEHSRPDIALELVYLTQAVALEDTDPPAFDRLSRDFKACGVRITDWKKQVAQARRKQDEDRKEAQAKAQREAAEAAKLQREQEREREGARATDDAPELSGHHWRLVINEGHGERSSSCDCYVSVPGRMYADITNEKEETRRQEIAVGCSAYVREELLRYSSPDAQPVRELVLSVCPAATKKLYDTRILASSFARMHPVEYLGSIATLAPGPGTQKSWAFVVGRGGEPRPEIPVYEFTGRHTTAGKPVYLSAGSVITETGEAPEVRVELEPDLARFALPTPPNEENLRAAILAGLACLELKPARMWVPLVGQAFAAALGYTRTVIYLHARQQSGKSTAASVVQRFFRKPKDAKKPREFPINLASDGSSSQASAAGIASVLSAVGSAVVVLDDYKFSGTIGQREGILDGVVRAVFESTARIRAKRSGEIRAPIRPRSAVIITGETLAANGPSFVSRCLTIEVPDHTKGECSNIGESSPIEQHAASGALASCMSGFIRWSLGRTAPELIPASTLPGATDRAAETLRQFATGAFAFLEFATEAGVLTPARRAELEAYVCSALVETIAPQQEAEQRESLAEIALNTLRSALSGSKAYLTNKAGKQPVGIEARAGWAPDSRVVDGAFVDCFKTHTGQTRIGYVDDAIIYLDRGPTMRSLREGYEKERGASFPVQDDKQLARELYEAGYLAKTDIHVKGRETHAVRGVEKRTFLALKRSVLWTDEQHAQLELPATKSKARTRVEL